MVSYSETLQAELFSKHFSFFIRNTKSKTYFHFLKDDVTFNCDNDVQDAICCTELALSTNESLSSDSDCSFVESSSNESIISSSDEDNDDDDNGENSDSEISNNVLDGPLLSCFMRNYLSSSARRDILQTFKTLFPDTSIQNINYEDIHSSINCSGVK